MDSQGKIRSIDSRLIDDLFGMGGGYVLDFSNRTFSTFFKEELGVNIDDPRFAADGTSKANRLRCFLNFSDQQTKVRTLRALWEYREADRRRNRAEETVIDAQGEFNRLIQRLGGSTSTQPLQAATLDRMKIDDLKAKLLEVSALAPQARGYAYERFLKQLFDLNGLSGRASFRLVGEQIDGSFELASETYLLEAKWEGEPTGANELRAFNGKVEEKAAWSRGLFVSESGFSKDGLVAFGRGKRVVCMDGLDIYDMLDRSLTFADIMAKKVRHAAETGNPFVRVRDL